MYISSWYGEGIVTDTAPVCSQSDHPHSFCDLRSESPVSFDSAQPGDRFGGCHNVDTSGADIVEEGVEHGERQRPMAHRTPNRPSRRGGTVTRASNSSASPRLPAASAGNIFDIFAEYDRMSGSDRRGQQSRKRQRPSCQGLSDTASERSIARPSDRQGAWWDEDEHRGPKTPKLSPSPVANFTRLPCRQDPEPATPGHNPQFSQQRIEAPQRLDAVTPPQSCSLRNIDPEDVHRQYLTDFAYISLTPIDIQEEPDDQLRRGQHSPPSLSPQRSPTLPSSPPSAENSMGPRGLGASRLPPPSMDIMDGRSEPSSRFQSLPDLFERPSLQIFPRIRLRAGTITEPRLVTLSQGKSRRSKPWRLTAMLRCLRFALHLGKANALDRIPRDLDDRSLAAGDATTLTIVLFVSSRSAIPLCSR